MGYFQGRGTAAVLITMMMLMMVTSYKGVVATNYQVGDGRWTIMSYDSWLSGKTFKVGDTLEFVYSSAHNVVEVSEANYGSCAEGSNTVYTNGDTTYTLSSVGTNYFICSIPTHCESGMKLVVNVEAASATTPTSSTPSTSPTPPSTTPSTSTPSTPSTTPTTPSTSSTTPSTSNSYPLSPSSLFFTLLISLGLSILFLKS